MRNLRERLDRLERMPHVTWLLSSLCLINIRRLKGQK